MKTHLQKTESKTSNTLFNNKPAAKEPFFKNSGAAPSQSVPQTPPPPNTTQRPPGVFNIKEVEEAMKYGTPMPGTYLVNESGITAYVKPENTGEAIPVGPGELYAYRIDGAATSVSGVYKVPDLGSVYVDKSGHIKPTGIVMSFWDLVGKDMGIKDQKWLEERQKNGDHGWDNLFNSIH